MSGDRLPKANADCPACGRSRFASGSRHCTSAGCEWARCKCGAIYRLHGTPKHYTNPADTTTEETP